jgi:hypothetical protein
MADSITLLAHPSRSFEGAKELRTEADGFLIAVSRTPLHCGARRLREEGESDNCVVIIRDAAGVGADVAGKIKHVLA